MQWRKGIRRVIRRLSCVLLALLTMPALAVAADRASVPAILTGLATIIDGDTIRIGGVKVRIKGIAAPEWDAPGGVEATAALRALIGDRLVRCELTGEVTYHRPVGWCTAGTTDLNREMVRGGWALACRRWDERGYRRLEAEARQRGGTVYRVHYELPSYCNKQGSERSRSGPSAEREKARSAGSEQ